MYFDARRELLSVKRQFSIYRGSMRREAMLADTALFSADLTEEE